MIYDLWKVLIEVMSSSFMVSFIFALLFCVFGIDNTQLESWQKKHLMFVKIKLKKLFAQCTTHCVITVEGHFLVLLLITITAHLFKQKKFTGHIRFWNNTSVPSNNEARSSSECSHSACSVSVCCWSPSDCGSWGGGWTAFSWLCCVARPSEQWWN